MASRDDTPGSVTGPSGPAADPNSGGAADSSPTVVDLVRDSTGGENDRVVVRLLDEDGEVTTEYARDALLATCDRIGRYLTATCGLPPGERVLMAYAPSADSVEGFLGCLFWGIVPVLAPTPDPERMEADLAAFRAVAKHTSAAAILTHRAYFDEIRPGGVRRLFRREPRGWPKLPWHCTDEAPAPGSAGSTDAAPGKREYRPRIADEAFYQVEATAPLKVGKIDHRALARQLRRQTSRAPKAREPLSLRMSDLTSFRALHKVVHALYVDARLHAPVVMSAVPRRRRRPSWDFGSMQFDADGSGPVAMPGVPVAPSDLIDSGAVPAPTPPRRARPTTGSQAVFSAGRRKGAGDLEAWKRRLKGE